MSNCPHNSLRGSEGSENAFGAICPSAALNSMSSFLFTTVSNSLISQYRLPSSMVLMGSFFGSIFILNAGLTTSFPYLELLNESMCSTNSCLVGS